MPSATTASPIYEGNVRFFSVGQMLIFIVAIVMAMIYVWKASSTIIDEPVKQLDTEKCLKVIRVSDYTIENSQVIDTLCLNSIIDRGFIYYCYVYENESVSLHHVGYVFLMEIRME